MSHYKGTLKRYPDFPRMLIPIPHPSRIRCVRPSLFVRPLHRIPVPLSVGSCVSSVTVDDRHYTLWAWMRLCRLRFETTENLRPHPS